MKMMRTRSMTNRYKCLVVLFLLCLCASGVAQGATILMIANTPAILSPTTFGAGQQEAVSWDQTGDIYEWEIFAQGLGAEIGLSGSTADVTLQFELRGALTPAEDPDFATTVGPVKSVTVTPGATLLPQVSLFRFSDPGFGFSPLPAARYFVIASFVTGTNPDALPVWSRGDAQSVFEGGVIGLGYEFPPLVPPGDTFNGWDSLAAPRSFSVEGVPEPGTLVLVGFALLAAGFSRRLRRN